MISCPKCQGPLARAGTPFGVVYHCARCKGRMVGLSTLRRDHVSQRFLNALWQTARYQRSPHGRICPHCSQAMDLVRMSADHRNLELDICRHCQAIWFDPTEYRRMPREAAAAAAPSGPGHRDRAGSAPTERPLSPKAKEAMAMLELERVKVRQRRTGGGSATDGPDEPWKLLPAILGMPVEVDAPALSARPVGTWGLAGLLVAVFLLTGTGAHEVLREFGFIPAQWDRMGGLTLFSGFFLHAGWLHLLGNLYFLLVFGDNVEDRLGLGRFLALAMLSHLAGNALHGTLDPRGDTPLVGASGGIFGLVAFYALAFPKVRLAFFLRLVWVRVPAWGMLGFYLALQLFGAWMQSRGLSSVSSLGHLGGIAVGVAAALLAGISDGRKRDTWFKNERGRAA